MNCWPTVHQMTRDNEADSFHGYCVVLPRRSWPVLVMETVSTSETSAIFHETTSRNVPEDCHLHTRRVRIREGAVKERVRETVLKAVREATKRTTHVPIKITLFQDTTSTTEFIQRWLRYSRETVNRQESVEIGHGELYMLSWHVNGETEEILNLYSIKWVTHLRLHEFTLQ
jgi:hypothetical protein